MEDIKKRIFVAINLPSKVRLEIEKNYLQKVSHGLENNSFVIKTCSKNNLHMTLKFLGYINQKQLKKVQDIIKGIVQKYKRFIIEIDGISTNNIWNPRVIWLDVKENPVLAKMTKSFEKQLTKNKFVQSEHQEFLPHVTLARIKKRISGKNLKKFNQMITELKNQRVSKFEAGSIDIMESQTLPEGSCYKLVKKFNLKGG
jgi:2'-5' RNA ligase